jgi:predicted amidophosphoribosyltransferase
MVKINPRKIEGPWREGYALDQHTVKSVYMGDDEFGHPRFDTTRSEIGELLYKLKYGNDQTVIGEIADAVEAHLRQWNQKVDLLVPVTPSKVRANQPVFAVGAEVARRLNIPFSTDIVIRRVALPQLKNIGRDERKELLKGAHDVQKEKVAGKEVLLFDDLYQSGSTMNAIAEALLDADAGDVIALTLTQAHS